MEDLDVFGVRGVNVVRCGGRLVSVGVSVRVGPFEKIFSN